MLQQLSPQRLSRRLPNLCFWVAFAALNTLLFLAMFLLDQQNSTLVLPASIAGDGWWLAINRLLIWRENLDPWRISVELTVLAALWVLVRWVRRPWVGVLFSTLYVLALSYYIYEAIVLSIFLLEPSFYSQFYLARDGLPFLVEHVNAAWWLYTGVLLGLALLGSIVIWLLNLLLRSGAAPGLHWLTRASLGGLALTCIAAALSYQTYTARPEMVASSLSFKLQKNIALSIKTQHDVASFDDSAVRRIYDYAGYQLETKPNIYLIFVESYGSVLYKRAHFRPPYTALLSELEETLYHDGWHMTTALSESPTWGGGSWLAYTSLLFGLRIDNHPQYLSLRNKYQVSSYPSLGNTLQQQGYHYVWLSALDENLADIAWARYTRLLGVDELIRNDDMQFTGPRYGWGPAPPDQWVLNWANEQVKARTNKPLLLFTITQNSHYPWHPHPTLADDWHTLNEPAPEVAFVDPDTISPEAMRRHYMNAVDYQLRMLTQFILDEGNENSLFILVGDHQPPAVSRRADGWSTPIHIISKNMAFIDSFTDYGFVPGLAVTNLAPSLRHEGFYSLFMRLLFGQYGTDKIAEPVYLPAGFVPLQAASN